MSNKETIDNLYYGIGKQQYNFELCYLTKEGSGSKWKKYLDVQANYHFIAKANNRTIFPNEIVLDIEDPEQFLKILEEVKKDFQFYSAYKTGSRGAHIHLWFNGDLSTEEKLFIIKKYGADEQKASARCMIALENSPHWKTGNPKTLVEEIKGFNEVSKVREEKLSILKNPNLFSYITEKELDKQIVGEYKSRKAIFLSLCSVWIENLDVPLNTLVSSDSSAGKSFVCKKIIKLFPPEMVEYRSKITPEAFTYWHRGENDWTWDGKICYLEDISQGILDAPTFKVMCSEGSTATIVMRQRAVNIHVEGKPVMLLTTARTNPNAEILNRYQIVSLDETEKQTEDIVFQIAKDETARDYDQDLIRSFTYLKREKIKVSFGEKIAFFLKENYSFNLLRLRRDFSRLLALIKASAALHQYQRKKDSEGQILANEQDYEIARECINYIQTQTFRGLTHRLKKALDCCLELKEFTAKEIHTQFPFVNQKTWYMYLDELSERGLLKNELRKVEDVKQRVTYYKVDNSKAFELPKFSDLIKTNTFVTKVTNDAKEQEDNCNNCNNFTNKDLIDFSESRIKEELENE